RVVTVSWRSAVIWDLDRLMPLRTVMHPDGYVCDACLDPTGAELWTVDSKARVFHWNAHTGDKMSEASLHLSARTYHGFDLRAAAFTPDCGVLLTGYDNRESFSEWNRGLEEGTAIVARWQLPDVRLQRVLELDTHWLNTVAIDREGALAATAGPTNGTVALWQIETGRSLRLLSGYTSQSPTQHPSALVFDS